VKASDGLAAYGRTIGNLSQQPGEMPVAKSFRYLNNSIGNKQRDKEWCKGIAREESCTFKVES